MEIMSPKKEIRRTNKTLRGSMKVPAPMFVVIHVTEYSRTPPELCEITSGTSVEAKPRVISVTSAA
jgi:hypothetical protein